MHIALVRRPMYPVGLLCFLMVLAGCNNASTGPIPTATTDPVRAATATPISQATIDPNCLRRDVENWIQVESEYSFAVISLMGEAVTLPPTGIQNILERLRSYQQAIEQAKVPICAADHAVLVKALFTRVIDGLTAYQGGQTVDLGKLYEEANTAYAEIRRIDQALRERYQSLP